MSEQEKVQADQEPEERNEVAAEVEDRPKGTNTVYGHQIVSCHGKRDGSLGRLLERLSTEELHENDYRAFKRIYDGATNNVGCPCCNVDDVGNPLVVEYAQHDMFPGAF